MINFQKARDRMVETQLAGRGISDQRVLDAMRKVPRHFFVDEALQEQAYSDHPLPIADKQTISQPYIVALMTEKLELQGHEKVLEIGTGSGYQAAILAELAQRVFSIERLPGLAYRANQALRKLGYTNVIVRVSDGTLGWPDEAPFDGIIVTAGAPKVPQPLVDQLAMGGRLVVPVGDRLSQSLMLVEHVPEGIRRTDLGGVRFVDLVGKWGWEE
ncbi:MAG: protein-L-isoaspartate(D-aspartate) O-methyltransferase [Syntrophobacteraceae bacterium]|jgi:protein-L-isoaspartate(D-aspartate) O-methyltransferase|nr:protein-L-isoaspartate(D-aspartate) O-methyltransferase [Syntrophobacteraceae bacterium]MCU0589375.1 protein-L-isoaspartate(D-aspartate) O-methyltransferase [Syntrophobacteraceae bacterium]